MLKIMNIPTTQVSLNKLTKSIEKNQHVSYFDYNVNRRITGTIRSIEMTPKHMGAEQPVIFLTLTIMEDVTADIFTTNQIRSKSFGKD